ncbi:hypothetical protein FJY94_01035 [Candidatus Kaiserbacteria bacterium]|nr:hypothetical protein [Candidatus Kaiserbacteria bacterium]
MPLCGIPPPPPIPLPPIPPPPIPPPGDAGSMPLPPDAEHTPHWFTGGRAPAIWMWPASQNPLPVQPVVGFAFVTGERPYCEEFSRIQRSDCWLASKSAAIPY